LSSGKSKKNAIFLEKMRFFLKNPLFARKYGAFSMVCQILKKSRSERLSGVFSQIAGNTLRRGAEQRFG